MTKKITKKQEKRLIDAAESLRKIQEKLAPYSEPSKIVQIPKESKWEKTSVSTTVFTKDDFESALRKIARPIKISDKEKIET